MSGKSYDPVDGEYGDTGEVRFRQYIRSCGYRADKHPHGQFGLDVEYVSDTERFYADIERRKRHWNGSEWIRFSTLHVLARRPVKPGVLFFTMSADMSKAYVSFPEDLETVEPVKMNNIHAQDELVRDHEIMRCLPLDLTKPIQGSIAEMNAVRVRKIVEESTSYCEVMRTLKGQKSFSFGAPYGISDDEWNEMLLHVERRSGLGEYVARNRKKHSQPSLF